MRTLRYALLAIPAIVLVAVLAGPIGPMPGIFIGGTPAEPPQQWSDTSDVDEITLKVPGLIPRVVTIWVVEHRGELHVIGSRDSGWVKKLGAGGPVEVRLGDDTYSLNASPAARDWEQILAAYVAKYQADYPDIVAGLPSAEEGAEQAAVFRLDRS